MGPGYFESITSAQAQPFQYRLYWVTRCWTFHACSRVCVLVVLVGATLSDLYMGMPKFQGLFITCEIYWYIDEHSSHWTNGIDTSFITGHKNQWALDGEYLGMGAPDWMMMCIVFQSSWELEKPTKFQSTQLCVEDLWLSSWHSWYERLG